MRKAKRGGGDLTRNFHKNRKVCKTGWVSGRLRDKDSTQDVCTKLSDMVKSDFCRSVVSISLCNGNICLFSCSGIAIARHGYRLTRFLTSASVVRAFNGKTSEHYFDLKIEVCHEGNEVYRGFLAEYDLVRNFAVVDVCDFLDVDVGILDRALKSVPHGEACVVGRGVSGDLMARSVELGGDLLRVYKDDKYNSKTTSKAWEGGAIFSFDGEVVGMNLFLATEIAVFLPWGTILKRLEFYWKSWEKETGLARSESLVYGFGASVGGKSNSHPEEHLNQEDLDIDSMGYPKLPSTGAGMILVNTFEETFGDLCGKGVWSKFSEKASAISRNVVALASFKGEKRFFACTGFFIRWNGSTKILTSASLIRNSCDENKIVENLRIEVSLPCNKCTQGTVVHSDLHYNIAIVSVENRRGLRPANTLLSWTRCFQVAAVGRCFPQRAHLIVTSLHIPLAKLLRLGLEAPLLIWMGMFLA